MKVPKSISSLVYELPKSKRWIWSICVWVVALTLMPLMLDVSRECSWRELAGFLTCGLGVAIGCVPLMKGELNRGHYILAAIVGVLSQVWVVLGGEPCSIWMLGAWCLYGLLLPWIWRWWCLCAEVLCLLLVVLSLIVG